MRPTAPHFIVKVSIQQEKQTKEKTGNLFIPQTATFMAFNTQCGEIVAIGEGAAEHFPEAKIGDTLLMHHFVQATDANKAKEEHLIYWDDEYHYYAVTAYEWSGKGNETYGVFDGEKIIPNKEYVFLVPKVVNQSLVKRDSGVLVYDGWTESREEKEDKMNRLKSESQSLALSGTNKDHIRQGIAEKEREMGGISKNINKQEFKPFTLAYANQQLSEDFGTQLQTGDTLFVLNQACGTIITFNETEYIVSKTRFVGALAR